jgi:hypothetical protein
VNYLNPKPPLKRCGFLFLQHEQQIEQLKSGFQSEISCPTTFVWRSFPSLEGQYLDYHTFPTFPFSIDFASLKFDFVGFFLGPNYAFPKDRFLN